MTKYLTAVLTIGVLGALAGGTISAVTPGGWSVLECTIIVFWICLGSAALVLAPMLSEW